MPTFTPQDIARALLLERASGQPAAGAREFPVRRAAPPAQTEPGFEAPRAAPPAQTEPGFDAPAPLHYPPRDRPVDLRFLEDPRWRDVALQMLDTRYSENGYGPAPSPEAMELYSRRRNAPYK
jgi:hypothetical protein